MFDDAQLRDAIDIQRRCYRLLRWVEKQLSAGELRFFVNHGVIDEVDAAEAWLGEVYRSLPDDARPPSDDGLLLRKYASYFTSYTLASMYVDQTPGVRAQPGLCGCTCPLCLRLSQASHFRSVQVGSAAKTQATRMSARVLVDVSARVGVALSTSEAEAILRDPLVRRSSALVAYARDLIDRIAGLSGHEASLALWRRFAYTESGAPIKGFDLTCEAVFEAVEILEQRSLAR